mgnify:CR=1 FL=1
MRPVPSTTISPGADGGPPYLVQWSDGHTGLIFPGPGAVLRVSSEDEAPEVAEPGHAPPQPPADAEQQATFHELGLETKLSQVSKRTVDRYRSRFMQQGVI